MQKIYTIIAGVNGVGKTTLTGVLKNELNLGCVIDVDQLVKLASGDNVAGSRIGIMKIRSCIHTGQSFTQETTLSGHHVIKTIQKAKSLGYKIIVYYIGLNTAEESIKRIKNRVEKGGHNIDETIIKRRFKKRFADLVKIMPLCDEIRFYDNDNDFQFIGVLKKKQLIEKCQSNPIWFSELIEYLDESKQNIFIH